MKTSIWDILTGIILLGMLCMIGAFGVIIMNPYTALNPLRPRVSPAEIVTPIVLPSATSTVPGLPPTWTPSPRPEDTKAPVNANGLRPSSTPMPTNTVVVLPSFTPSKTPRTGISGGTCSITMQDPADNTTLTHPNDPSFTVHWNIKNTSKDVWRADSVDIRWVSGTEPYTAATVLDMPYDVGVDGMLDFQVTLKMPPQAGSYVSNWKLVNGSNTVCAFYITYRK